MGTEYLSLAHVRLDIISSYEQIGKNTPIQTGLRGGGLTPALTTRMAATAESLGESRP